MIGKVLTKIRRPGDISSAPHSRDVGFLHTASVREDLLAKESATLRDDAERLMELRDFLAVRNNPANYKRIAEITGQLERIETTLQQLSEEIRNAT